MKIRSLLLMAALLMQAACGAAERDTAAREFALNLHRVAGYVRTTTFITKNLHEEHVLTRDAALEVATVLLQVNTVGEKLAAEAKTYLSTDPQTGEEILLVTEEGKLRLNDLAQSLLNVVDGTLRSQVFAALPVEARTRVERVTAALRVAARVVAQIVDKLQAIKESRVTLKADVVAEFRGAASDFLSFRQTWEGLWASR